MRKRLVPAFVLALATTGIPSAFAQVTDPDRVTEESEQEPLPYRGTSIVYENAAAAYTFDRTHDLTYNPTYAMSWAFNPRWYLYDNLSARLSFSVEVELTNSDWTSSKYEPTMSDTTLGFIWTDFYTIPAAEIRLGGGLTFNFPTSEVSQARSLYFGLAPSLSIRRIFDVLGGLTISYGFKYTKNFNQYTTLMSDIEQFPCPLNIPDRSACFNMGVRNPSMSFSNTFTVEQYFTDYLYAALTFGMVHSLLYPETAASVDTIGGEVDVPEASDNTDLRATMNYGFEVGYDATQYLSVAAGWSTQNPQLDEEGNWRAPFINRYTTVYLDVALSVDGLVTEFTESDEEDEAADEMASGQDRGAVAARW